MHKNSQPKPINPPAIIIMHKVNSNTLSPFPHRHNLEIIFSSLKHIFFSPDLRNLAFPLPGCHRKPSPPGARTNVTAFWMELSPPQALINIQCTLKNLHNIFN